MENKLKIGIWIPIERVLKEREKVELSQRFIYGLTENGIEEATLTHSYYVERRSAAEPLNYLVLLYIAGVADVVSILMAIWTVLKEKQNTKEVTVQISEGVCVKIKGNMSQEELLQLIKEAKKPIGKKKE